MREELEDIKSSWINISTITIDYQGSSELIKEKSSSDVWLKSVFGDLAVQNCKFRLPEHHIKKPVHQKKKIRCMTKGGCKIQLTQCVLYTKVLA